MRSREHPANVGLPENGWEVRADEKKVHVVAQLRGAHQGLTKEADVLVVLADMNNDWRCRWNAQAAPHFRTRSLTGARQTAGETVAIGSWGLSARARSANAREITDTASARR